MKVYVIEEMDGPCPGVMVRGVFHSRQGAIDALGQAYYGCLMPPCRAEGYDRIQSTDEFPHWHREDNPYEWAVIEEYDMSKLRR